MVQLRDAGGVAAEAVRVALVTGQKAVQHVVPTVLARRHGAHLPLHAEKTELGERRALELVVGKDFDALGMVHGQEVDLVEVGHLPQLLGDPHLVVAVGRDERLAGDLDVLVVIDREVVAVAGGGTGLGHCTVSVGAGQPVSTGGVVSCTVMVWVQLVVLPQLSLAVQVRVMVLLQSGPLDVSLKLTATVPSQLSLAVTVAAAGTSLTHCTLRVAAGQPLSTGGVLSMRVL